MCVQSRAYSINYLLLGFKAALKRHWGHGLWKCPMASCDGRPWSWARERLRPLGGAAQLTLCRLGQEPLPGPGRLGTRAGQRCCQPDGGTRPAVTILSFSSLVTTIRIGPKQLTTSLSDALPATVFLLFLVICEDPVFHVAGASPGHSCVCTTQAYFIISPSFVTLKCHLSHVLNPNTDFGLFVSQVRAFSERGLLHYPLISDT